MGLWVEEVKKVLLAIDTCHFNPPAVLVAAVVAAEDRRFYWHRGFDPIGVFRALAHLIVQRRIEGASTVEAQLWRTITGRREITMARKLREISSASYISLSRPKSRIIACYLDNA